MMAASATALDKREVVLVSRIANIPDAEIKEAFGENAVIIHTDAPQHEYGGLRHLGVLWHGIYEQAGLSYTVEKKEK